MSKSLRIQGLFVLVMLVAAAGVAQAQLNEKLFELDKKVLTGTLAPSGWEEFHIKISNMSFLDITMRVIRIENDMPNAEWSNSICTGEQCYDVEQDTTNFFTIPGGGSIDTKITVIVGAETGKSGRIVLKFDSGEDTPADTAVIDAAVLTSSVGSNAPTVALGTFYPNPTSGVLHYSYSLPAAGTTAVEVSTVTGKRVQTPVSGYQDSGIHSLDLNLSELPSGVYVVTLITNGQRVSRMVTVAR